MLREYQSKNAYSPLQTDHNSSKLALQELVCYDDLRRLA